MATPVQVGGAPRPPMESRALEQSIHQAGQARLRSPDTGQPPPVDRMQSTPLRAPETGKGTVVDVIG